MKGSSKQHKENQISHESELIKPKLRKNNILICIRCTVYNTVQSKSGLLVEQDEVTEITV